MGPADAAIAAAHPLTLQVTYRGPVVDSHGFAAAFIPLKAQANKGRQVLAHGGIRLARLMTMAHNVVVLEKQHPSFRSHHAMCTPTRTSPGPRPWKAPLMSLAGSTATILEPTAEMTTTTTIRCRRLIVPPLQAHPTRSLVLLLKRRLRDLWRLQSPRFLKNLVLFPGGNPNPSTTARETCRAILHGSRHLHGHAATQGRIREQMRDSTRGPTRGPTREPI